MLVDSMAGQTRSHVMIYGAKTRYDPTKSAVLSKFKRLPRPKAGAQSTALQLEGDTVASGFDAGKASVVLQSAAGEDGAASPDVDVADIHGGAGRPAGGLSPEKDPARP